MSTGLANADIQQHIIIVDLRTDKLARLRQLLVDTRPPDGACLGRAPPLTPPSHPFLKPPGRCAL